jgi:hypothetical protein
VPLPGSEPLLSSPWPGEPACKYLDYTRYSAIDNVAAQIRRTRRKRLRVLAVASMKMMEAVSTSEISFSFYESTLSEHSKRQSSSRGKYTRFIFFLFRQGYCLIRQLPLRTSTQRMKVCGCQRKSYVNCTLRATCK